MSNLPTTLEGSPTTPLLEEVCTLNQLNTSGFLAVPVKSSFDAQPDNADHRTSIEAQHASKSVSSAPNESLGAAKPSDGSAFKSSTQATWNVFFQPQKPLMEDMKPSIDSWQGDAMFLRWLSQAGISYQLQSMDPWMEPLWKEDSKAIKGTGQWMTVSIPLDARKKGASFVCEPWRNLRRKQQEKLKGPVICWTHRLSLGNPGEQRTVDRMPRLLHI